MSEELYVPHTACYGLRAVDFKVEYLLYEVSDGILDTFSRSRGLAEDDAKEVVLTNAKILI